MLIVLVPGDQLAAVLPQRCFLGRPAASSQVCHFLPDVCKEDGSQIVNCTMVSAEPSSTVMLVVLDSDSIGHWCPLSVLNAGSTGFHGSCSL